MADEYVRISREALLNAKEKINMDLFFRRDYPDGTNEYVLFAKAGLGPVAFQKIADNPVGALYTKAEEQSIYGALLENSLDNIISDTHTPFDEKTEAVYNTATHVLKDVFDDPRSGENIKRSRDIVSSMVGFALREQGAIKGLLGLGKKDYYTFSHCVHVSVFCIGVAKVFGIHDRDELFKLGLGALMHDVGKTKISLEILNKPGRLTLEEFEEIKKHPVYGYEMCKGTLPESSLDIVLHHHEKYDGTGYPDGLSRDQISFFAKLACMADVYDALTTNRSYAKARDPFSAIMTMKEEMVGHFEQDKFVTFIQMLGPGSRV